MHIQLIKSEIIEFLNKLPGPNRSACIKLMNDHEERILKAPGSLHKHQAYAGGYLAHIYSCLAISTLEYESLSRFEQLPFAWEDSILPLFLHDFEKPFKYVEPKTDFVDEIAKSNFVKKLINDYAITLTEEQWNALTYIHGEGDKHNPTTRIQLPLAAFCHNCDNASARMFPFSPTVEF